MGRERLMVIEAPFIGAKVEFDGLCTINLAIELDENDDLTRLRVEVRGEDACNRIVLDTLVQLPEPDAGE